MSSSNAITIHKPFDLSEAGVDSAKHQRYNLCLHFIKGIIRDLDALKDDNDPVFDQLGHIACCIDTYVDELNHQIKYELQDSFQPFFDSLATVNDLQQFQIKCLEYRSKTLFLAEQPCSYAALYEFFSLCRELDLLEELRSFSMEIIDSSIKKQEAVKVQDLLNSVRDEGLSAVNFLVLFLQRKGVIYAESSSELMNYFSKIERVLNIADEILDCRSDKRKGIIQLPLNIKYFSVMFWQLNKAIFSALIHSPIHFIAHCSNFTFKAVKLELNK